MSNPASPSSSPSKAKGFSNRNNGGSDSHGNEDEMWEEAYAKLHEQKPLFPKLPSTPDDAAKVFKKCECKSHVGPIVLTRGIPEDVFSEWLHHSELGLHKSERLKDGTVYVPQACAEDHGILRGLLHKERYFPILNEENVRYLSSGSGAREGLNPDIFWFGSGDRPRQSSVLFEIGISQSLPDLRRRAYTLCSATHAWKDLQYVILIKRYKTRRIYIEVWRRTAAVAGAVGPSFDNDQRAPAELEITETMEFVANAHASNGNVKRSDSLAWQFYLPQVCDIPSSDSLCDGATDVSFDAQTLLNKCHFDDLE